MNYKKPININDFVDKYGIDCFVDSLKLAAYKTGQKVIKDSDLSDMERRVVEWFDNNLEYKLKDFFLADLSWPADPQDRHQDFIDFFTKRTGKRVLSLLPEDIKNYVLANSI